MNKEVMFSSKSSDWSTPWELFNDIDEELCFTLDVCATKENTKVPENYYTERQNGLVKPWSGNCWMNPPYGRQIKHWVKRAYYQGQKANTNVVCLLPARTDTRWFHDYCWKADAILFFKGRIKFGGHKNSAPFPSCLVLFGSGFPEDTKLDKYGKIILCGEQR